MIVRKWQIQYIAIRYIFFFRDSRSVAALLQRNFAAAITFSRAFQFGQKSFGSILFDFRYRIDFFDSIRFGNLINLPLVHWYSNSKLGKFYSMHCVTVFSYSFKLHALWCILIKNHGVWCVCVIYLVQKLHDKYSESKCRFFYKRIDSNRFA